MFYVNCVGLSVVLIFVDFVEIKVLSGMGLIVDVLWIGLVEIFVCFVLVNCVLLIKCDEMQVQIDVWYLVWVGQVWEVVVYQVFLIEIGYFVFEFVLFMIDMVNVDVEVVMMVGFQLVVLLFND